MIFYYDLNWKILFKLYTSLKIYKFKCIQHSRWLHRYYCEIQQLNEWTVFNGRNRDFRLLCAFDISQTSILYDKIYVRGLHIWYFSCVGARFWLYKIPYWCRIFGYILHVVFRITDYLQYLLVYYLRLIIIVHSTPRKKYVGRNNVISLYIHA